jgi:hypothetical protein
MMRGFSWLVVIVSALLAVGSPIRAQTSNGDGGSAIPLSERLREIEGQIASQPRDLAAHIRRLDILYLLGVEDEDYVEAGFESLDDLETRFAGELRAADQVDRITALRGALTTLRAKHSFWPHHKLGHVERGMALLDDAVAGKPDSAPVRYLRLMSGFYLPGILGRKDEVEADFQALVELLPDARADFPPDLYPVIVDFVLHNAALSDEQRIALERLLVQS